MRTIPVLILFSITLTLLSCKQKEAASEALGDTLPEDFVTFYERFLQDSLYQMEHINFPLEGIPDNALKDNRAYSIKLVIGARNVRTQVEFRSEAESMSAMDHPNIVKVHEYGEIEDQPYIIMDYVERGTLHAIMKEYKFDQEGIASMAIMICDGLSYAHEKGYVHRDIKPDNIMISEDWTPKIMDFGLAVDLNNPNYGYTAVGSRGYAAPEVASDPENIDQRVDVYAMGGVLYSMLTNEIPDDKNPDFDKLQGYDVRFKMIIKNAMNPVVSKRTESVDAIKARLMSMMKSWKLRSGE